MPRTPAVTIIYFPKGKKAAAPLALPAVTQTIPELRAPGRDEEKTDPSVGIVSAPPEFKRPKARRKTTHEIPQVEVAGAADGGAGGPQTVADLAMFGHQLFELGRLEEARVIFEGLVSTDASDVFAHTMLGTIYLARGDLKRALALFQAALESDPNDLAALVYRAEIRLNQKKAREALVDLERVIARGPRGDPFVDRAKRLAKLARAVAPRRSRG
jgi:tetratricopeptide (TPR) repeat protein